VYNYVNYSPHRFNSYSTTENPPRKIYSGFTADCKDDSCPQVADGLWKQQSSLSTNSCGVPGRL